MSFRTQQKIITHTICGTVNVLRNSQGRGICSITCSLCRICAVWKSTFCAGMLCWLAPSVHSAATHWHPQSMRARRGTICLCVQRVLASLCTQRIPSAWHWAVNLLRCGASGSLHRVDRDDLRRGVLLWLCSSPSCTAQPATAAGPSASGC